MKRLCFLSPDLDHARRTVHALRQEGIEDQHIFVIGPPGLDLEDLPDAGPEGDDFLPGYERGLALGGLGGLLAGLLAVSFPPAGVTVGGAAVLLLSAYGAGLGGLLTGIAGAAFPNSRLSEFQQQIEAGQLLIIVEVPKTQAEWIEKLVADSDPAIEVLGSEPRAPLIP
jgi:hypothetical protein